MNDNNSTENIIELEVGEVNWSVQEAVNTLRSNIIFSGENIKMISVTSSLPGEGKSLIAFYLAKNFAAMGKKTLYVDCDLRKSVTLSRYNINKDIKGITEFVAGQDNRVINQTNIKNLYVVVGKKIAPNPTEILSSERFSMMLNVFKEHFDYVIVDTPPVLSVIDPVIVSSKVDGTVFVVRANMIKRKAVAKAKQQLELGGGKILGVALNGIDVKGNKYYNNYYSRYYSKKYYNKYYGSESESEEFK